MQTDPPTLGARVRWEVAIPGYRPASLNTLLRLHWATRLRRVQAEGLIVGLAVRGAGVPRARRRRRVGMTITLAGRDRRLDDDNAWKLMLDGLVRCGALVDDGPDWVERMPIAYDRGPARKTTITIEDTDEPEE